MPTKPTKKTVAKTPPPKKTILVYPYTVVRDTREHEGEGWVFEETQFCEGTVKKGLKTGDYSLVGYEHLFTIERKKNTAEFAKNITEKRFDRELDRLEDFAFPFLILEFTMEDLMRWPQSSGLPPRIQYKIKISKHFLLKRLLDFQMKYKTKIIMAGPHGKDICSNLFKRITEHYRGEPPKQA